MSRAVFAVAKRHAAAGHPHVDPEAAPGPPPGSGSGPRPAGRGGRRGAGELHLPTSGRRVGLSGFGLRGAAPAGGGEQRGQTRARARTRMTRSGFTPRNLPRGRRRTRGRPRVQVRTRPRPASSARRARRLPRRPRSPAPWPDRRRRRAPASSPPPSRRGRRRVAALEHRADRGAEPRPQLAHLGRHLAEVLGASAPARRAGPRGGRRSPPRSRIRSGPNSPATGATTRSSRERKTSRPDPSGTGRLIVKPSPRPGADVLRQARPRPDPLLLDRDQEDVVAVAEDRFGAVAVVDVPVEDQDPRGAEPRRSPAPPRPRSS